MDFAGLKPEEMAVALEVSPNTVYNYLAGRTRPNKSTRKNWAEVCGVDFAWVEGGGANTGWVTLGELPGSSLWADLTGSVFKKYHAACR